MVKPCGCGCVVVVGVVPAGGTDANAGFCSPGIAVALSYDGGGAAYFSSDDIISFSLFSRFVVFKNYDLDRICE